MTTDLHDRTFTIDESVDLIGVSRATLHQWRDANLIQTSGDGCRGRPLTVDAVGLLAIGIIRSLRRKGATLGMVRPIAEYLTTLTVDDLMSAMDEGRHYLVSAGEILPARLTGEEDIIANRTGWADVLVCLDIRDCWRKLERGVADYDRRQIITMG